MDSENANLEERLKSLLFQLSSESGILERIVHKSKNQHRGSLYFQALLKVRRDLKLLQSAGLGQILNSLFHITRGKSSTETACHLKLNMNKYLGGKHTYHNRLLGVARLLSQMVEPILKAAMSKVLGILFELAMMIFIHLVTSSTVFLVKLIATVKQLYATFAIRILTFLALLPCQISLLFAKTFFMGFSLTILACLGRLRVLVQQILIDVVSVFNMVSVQSQKHSLKLSGEGIEAFVDYYSTSGDILTLECIWEDDKYVLHESTQCRNNNIPEEQGAIAFKTPIEYQTSELFGKGSCTEQEAKLPNWQPHTYSSLDQIATTDRSIKSKDLKISPITESACEPISGSELQTSLMTLKPQSKSRKTVAFVPVQIPKTETEPGQAEKKMRLSLPSSRNPVDSTAADDPFPDSPFSGSQNMSLF